jgi:hypothetical protein
MIDITRQLSAIVEQPLQPRKMCSLDRSGEHGKAVLRNPLSTISCVGLPYNCALFLEQKSHSSVFEALSHPMRNDSILSTPDVSFVRLFWSQGNPRISSVTLRGRSSVISPRPCLLVPAGVFEIRKDNQNFLLTERRSKLRDGGHR